MTVEDKSFKIITLGCKVNQYESAYLKEALLQAGWRQAGNRERADTVIINTCIVTQTAAHQSRQAIGKAIRENRNSAVAATGCYAQVFADELRRIDGIGLIAGNTVKGRLPEIILNGVAPGSRSVILEDFAPGMAFEHLPLRRFSDRTRAYVKVQDGCRSYCSYCIVPYSRGPLRSLESEKVLSTIASLTRGGCREIVLTGIHLGKYGVDLGDGMSLKRLLRAIGREKFPVRVRLSSLEPNEIDADLIEMTASEEWICRHFHIPLQSGDNMILKKMNRGYNARHFGRVVKAIRDMMPHAGIGVDVMAGFPGETYAMHLNTVSFIRDLPVSYLHVFPFSRRQGTPAATFDDQVDSKDIKKRAAELRDISQEKRAAFYSTCLGHDFLVLAEGWHLREESIMKGTSDNYLPVLFHSVHESTGQLVSVCVKKIDNNVVFGF